MYSNAVVMAMAMLASEDITAANKCYLQLGFT